MNFEKNAVILHDKKNVWEKNYQIEFKLLFLTRQKKGSYLAGRKTA